MKRLGFLLVLGLWLQAIHADTAYQFPSSDESLIWFPAVATQQSNGWTLTVHGMITEDEKRPAISWLSRKILGFSPEELGPAERQRFQETTRRFMGDDESGKDMEIEIANRRFDLGETERNGHFAGTIVLEQKLLLSRTNPQSLPCVLYSNRRNVSNQVPVCVIEREGISVISDIDDTIKISNVRDRDELLRNTFLRPFRAVDGMFATYQRWAQNSGARFHYVSGSPWQLFPVLHEFAATNQFPEGSWHLRTARLTGFSSRQLLKAPDDHKEPVIKELFTRLDKRKFILVGDSGERDPEIYGNMTRQHPRRVLHIYIRDVTAEAASSARYRKAFRDLPRDSWTIFKNADELPARLSR